MASRDLKRPRTHIDASAIPEARATAAASTPLAECGDDALVAELKRRNISLEPVSDALVGASYDAGAKLGEGACAAVFAAKRHGSHKHREALALKVTGDDDALARLSRVSRSLSLSLALPRGYEHPPRRSHLSRPPPFSLSLSLSR